MSFDLHQLRGVLQVLPVSFQYQLAYIDGWFRVLHVLAKVILTFAKKPVEGKMIARLVEMYRFNDLLRSELRDKHQIDFDEEAGEVVSVQFGRRE